MSTITDNLASASDSTLEAVVGIQQRIVDIQREFASLVTGVLPDAPSWLQPSDDVDVPGPKELLEQGFSFQSRLLDANKEFALGLIEAWARPASSTSKS